MTNEELINDLIDAAYDSGYYNGIDDTNYRDAVIRQEKARRAIFARFVPIEHLRQRIIDLEAAVAYDQATIDNLEAEVAYYREAGISLAHELEEAA